MILTALLLFAAQTGDPSVAAAPQPVGKPALDPDKMICRRETVTGSNMSRKVCRSRGEWNRQMRENGGAAERLRGPIQACHGSALCGGA